MQFLHKDFLVLVIVVDLSWLLTDSPALGLTI